MDDAGAWGEHYRALLKWVSVKALAVLTIGATGWSSGEWRCTYADLTPEGKALYDNLQNLYPGR
jgi:hypothetical protein